MCPRGRREGEEGEVTCVLLAFLRHVAKALEGRVMATQQVTTSDEEEFELEAYFADYIGVLKGFIPFPLPHFLGLFSFLPSLLIFLFYLKNYTRS
jgi:hypothetical protein